MFSGVVTLCRLYHSVDHRGVAQFCFRFQLHCEDQINSRVFITFCIYNNSVASLTLIISQSKVFNGSI